MSGLFTSPTPTHTEKKSHYNDQKKKKKRGNKNLKNVIFNSRGHIPRQGKGDIVCTLVALIKCTTHDMRVRYIAQSKNAYFVDVSG